MKKAILAIVLLLMIVAVSYIQAVRRDAKVDNSFILGKRASEKEVLELKSAADSLKTKLGEQEVIHAESLLVRDKMLRRNQDSLANIIILQEKSISELKKKASSPVSQASKGAANSEKLHRELLAFYKKRFESLPNDLSEYERKVAVSEIRQETADKFSISLAEFNRIRETNKLNY